MGLIDSHAHLTYEGLFHRIDDVLARCNEAGVDKIITIGTDLDHTVNAIQLAGKYPDRIHVAAAFHPHEAANVSDDDIETMVQHWSDPAIVAAGEMGLDYHYDFADRNVQRAVFGKQLEAAKSYGKPVIIHCRDALDDTEALLVEKGFDHHRVVFHCFTGTAQDAARIASHGWRISFTGIVTFKKSTWLQEIAKNYPSEQIMVETDSPYLSPVPVRGKDPNEPSFVAHTAKFLAELRGVEYEQFANDTYRNTIQFFSL